MKYVLSLVLVFLVGCGGSGSKDVVKVKKRISPEIVNGYVLPPMPDKKLNDATLKGIDSNDNGIRDDVERELYQDKFLFKNKKTQKVLVTKLKKQQYILEHGLTRKEATKEAKESIEIVNCLDGDTLRQYMNIKYKYRDFLLNTPERIKKYVSNVNKAHQSDLFSTITKKYSEADCKIILKDIN